MGKRVGKPYDPDLRYSEEGARLYQAWRRVRSRPHCDEWEDFQTFYEWAVENGYEFGDWLQLVEGETEYAPDNCVWYTPQGGMRQSKHWMDKWNKSVNRIRKHYGMPALRGTSYDDL